MKVALLNLTNVFGSVALLVTGRVKIDDDSLGAKALCMWALDDGCSDGDTLRQVSLAPLYRTGRWMALLKRSITMDSRTYALTSICLMLSISSVSSSTLLSSDPLGAVTKFSGKRSFPATELTSAPCVRSASIV